MTPAALPVHRVCRQTITFKVIIADDGLPALVRFCPSCDEALIDEDCDPTELLIADVPRHFIAQLLKATDDDNRGRVQ